jgi:trk system potassium uptake protein
MRIRLASSAPLDAPRPRTRKNVNPSRIIVSTFALAILLGTALLSLPAAAAGGAALSWLDALFLATSAVCVTA